MSPTIRVDTELREASGGRLALGVLQAAVTVSQHDHALWQEIDDRASRLATTALETIAHLAPVQALRAIYKALGTDPSRYRGGLQEQVARATALLENYAAARAVRSEITF